ncbi:hypothetical protein AURDEDRAFT_131113 [Auricularia subglabra TFB-10046 SS5]|uniref:Uncharacterized protein n=1 Tax=Auricularia subglabra (strain TFB-10046 / SS5) TaxID=717982 RepID=J0CVT9_AURST|nr:hypothetical protein AURDEDRAFT_131113 [Auricularia subglabra TFB-10046 SS5]
MPKAVYAFRVPTGFWARSDTQGRGPSCFAELSELQGGRCARCARSGVECAVRLDKDTDHGVARSRKRTKASNRVSLSSGTCTKPSNETFTVRKRKRPTARNDEVDAPVTPPAAIKRRMAIDDKVGGVPSTSPPVTSTCCSTCDRLSTEMTLMMRRVLAIQDRVAMLERVQATSKSVVDEPDAGQILFFEFYEPPIARR